MTATIEERLGHVIYTYCDVDEKRLRPDSHLRDDLGFDSLDMVEVVMGIEEEFGFGVHDAEVENLVTYGDLLRLVNQRTGEPQHA